VVLKKHHCERRVDCKKCDRKKQRSVDCAEADKKTVQAMRYEWWGFLAAEDCSAALPVMNSQAKPDRFSLVFYTKKNPLAVLTVCKQILRILGIWRKWKI